LPGGGAIMVSTTPICRRRLYVAVVRLSPFAEASPDPRVRTRFPPRPRREGHGLDARSEVISRIVGRAKSEFGLIRPGWVDERLQAMGRGPRDAQHHALA